LAAKTAHEKTVLQRQIDNTDKQIDQLVYELYGLTKEEIKIVEESTQGLAQGRPRRARRPPGSSRTREASGG